MRTTYNVQGLTLLSGKPFYTLISYPRYKKNNCGLTTNRHSRNWVKLSAVVTHRLISARAQLTKHVTWCKIVRRVSDHTPRPI